MEGCIIVTFLSFGYIGGTLTQIEFPNKEKLTYEFKNKNIDEIVDVLNFETRPYPYKVKYQTNEELMKRITNKNGIVKSVWELFYEKGIRIENTLDKK